MMSVNWKKTLTVVLDIMLAGYIVLSFTAFHKTVIKARVCKKVKIHIQY